MNVMNYVNELNAARAIISTFGDRQFTTAEYNQFIKTAGGTTLVTLRNDGLVDVARVEKFQKEAPLSYWESSIVWVFGHDGSKLMPKSEFDKLPDVAKQAMVKLNNGLPFEFEGSNTKLIECDRYYHIINREKVDRLAKQAYRHVREALERKEKELLKLVAEVDDLRAIMPTL